MSEESACTVLQYGKKKKQTKSKTKNKYIILLANDKRANGLKHNFLYRIVDNCDALLLNRHS